MKIKVFLSFLFSVIFLYILYKNIGFNNILKNASLLNPYDVLVAFFLYSVSSFLRAYRWHTMINQINMFEFYIINNIHIFLNNILPARTGELSFFYLLKKRNITLSKSFWVFVLARLMDGLSLLGFFISMFFKVYIMPVVIFSFGLLMIIILKYAIKILPPFFILKALKENLKDHFEIKVALKLYTLSVFSFFIKFLSFYIATYNILKIPFLKIIPSYVFSELSSILPINGFMGFGTYEFGFSSVYKLTGLNLVNSVDVGFITHMFLLISSSLLGIFSILVFKSQEHQDLLSK